jgi:hypothetical protein
MGRLLELQPELVKDGKITGREVAVIQDYVREQGNLDIDDVMFLAELAGGAREISPAFDELLNHFREKLESPFQSSENC